MVHDEPPSGAIYRPSNAKLVMPESGVTPAHDHNDPTGDNTERPGNVRQVPTCGSQGGVSSRRPPTKLHKQASATASKPHPPRCKVECGATQLPHESAPTSPKAAHPMQGYDTQLYCATTGSPKVRASNDDRLLRPVRPSCPDE